MKNMQCSINVIIGTVRSLWTWLWSRYHVPHNVFLVKMNFTNQTFILTNVTFILMNVTEIL